MESGSMSISKHEIAVLSHLAIFGPSAGHDMRDITGNPSVVAKRLKRKGLITGKYMERNGHPIELLSISELGYELLSILR